MYMSDILRLYRVRDKTSGLYSSGGTRPKWGNGGKTWYGIGPLKNHLRQHVDLRKDEEYRRLYDEYEASFNYPWSERRPAYEARWKKHEELMAHWWDFIPEDWEVVVDVYVHSAHGLVDLSR